MICSVVVLILASALFRADAIGGESWAVLTGIGTYVAYTLPYAAFDRLVAATGWGGSCAFLLFITDGESTHTT